MKDQLNKNSNDNKLSFVEILRRNWVILLLLFCYVVIFAWKTPIDSYLGLDATQKLLGESIYKGWLGLEDYLSAHILMCLIPAFFIAGAINTLIDASAILKYLGRGTKKWLGYLIASLGGFFIQVCSCTILPLFAGIWKKGAGLGVAITFLYAGPAINILTFILTGQRLGWDFGIIRLILSVVFAILTGMIMEFLFKDEDHLEGEMILSDEKDQLMNKKRSKFFWFTLFMILIVGTAPLPATIKNISFLLLLVVQTTMTFLWIDKERRKSWWRETIKFTTDIIPLLLVGVFFAGVITHLIPEQQFQELLGKNTILTNLVAVLFGAIAYFPALVEVPIAENFLRLGMNKGPLMSYLLSDPVLSLQGLLIIGKILGVKKTVVYTLTITILTTIAGYIFGLLF